MQKIPCKESESCRARVWYINNQPWSLNSSNKELEEHKCWTYPVSSFPSDIFVGVWKNDNSGNIRYGVPQKKEENARKPPDNHGKWTLQRVLHSKPDWVPLPDTITTYFAGSHYDNYGSLRKRT